MSGVDHKKKWFALAAPLDASEDFKGVTVVIAPHPDDESLGCGGTIALLKKAGRSVKIIFVSDGSLSHPNSKKYPAPLLIKLREKEALSAAKILGVNKTDCYFMRLKDGSLPDKKQHDFSEVVNAMAKVLEPLNIDTILLPWKNDPHKDHKACWQIVAEAIKQLGFTVNLLHYLIWFWERGMPEKEILKSVNWFRTDITLVTHLKLKAIAAHKSQVTNLIDDDEQGFMLSDGVLNHFNDTFELFAKQKIKYDEK